MPAIPRIYTASDLAISNTVQLEGASAHHLTNVLRVKLGDCINLFNGDGHHYLSKIIQIKRQQLTVEVLTQSSASRPSQLNIHLIQGIARGEKMDWIIQKAVELGVETITPLLSERTQVRSRSLTPNKLNHWQKVLISATEQCGRNRLATLHPPQLINQIKPSDGLCLALHPGEQNQWPMLTSSNINRLTLAIGPESGFSDTDLQVLKDRGFQMTRMGPRILRSETAPLTAITIAQSLWGDLLL